MLPTQPRDVEYINLADGRKLCLECLDTSLMVTDDSQTLIQELLRFYDSLGMTIKQQIPILLVERQALNEAREGERDVSHDAHTSDFVKLLLGCLCRPFCCSNRHCQLPCVVINRAATTALRQGAYAFRRSKLSAV